MKNYILLRNVKSWHKKLDFNTKNSLVKNTYQKESLFKYNILSLIDGLSLKLKHKNIAPFTFHLIAMTQ